MGRYIENKEGIVGASSYVPLPVEAFAKNAQNLQDRYDKANLIESQKLDEIGKLARIDQEKYKENLTAFQEKLKKTAEENDFDLGRGLNQIVNVIGTEATNPYYNANAYHVEEAKKFREAQNKLGDKGIIVNNPYDYKLSDVMTNGKGLGQLNARIDERNDYQGNTRALIQDLHSFSEEHDGIITNSKLLGWYASKGTSKEELSKSMLEAYAKTPELINAWEVANTTAGYDPTKFSIIDVNGKRKAFNQIDPNNPQEVAAKNEAIKDYIYGVALGKERLDTKEKIQYVENKNYTTNLQTESAKKIEDYKALMSQQSANKITANGVKVDADSFEKAKTNLGLQNKVVSDLQNLNKQYAIEGAKKIWGEDGGATHGDLVQNYIDGKYDIYKGGKTEQEQIDNANKNRIAAAKILGLNDDQLKVLDSYAALYNKNGEVIKDAQMKQAIQQGYINDINRNALEAAAKNNPKDIKKIEETKNELFSNIQKNPLLAKSLNINSKEDIEKLIELNKGLDAGVLSSAKLIGLDGKPLLGEDKGFFGSIVLNDKYSNQKGQTRESLMTPTDVKHEIYKILNGASGYDGFKGYNQLTNEEIKKGEIQSSAIDAWEGTSDKWGIGAATKQIEKLLNGATSNVSNLLQEGSGTQVYDILENAKNNGLKTWDKTKKTDYKIQVSSKDLKGNPIVQLFAYQGNNLVAEIPNVSLANQPDLKVDLNEAIAQEWANVTDGTSANVHTNPHKVREFEKLYGKGMMGSDFYTRFRSMRDGDSFEFKDDYKRPFKLNRIGELYQVEAKNSEGEYVPVTQGIKPKFQGDEGSVEQAVGKKLLEWDTDPVYRGSSDSKNLNTLIEKSRVAKVYRTK